MSVPSPVIQTEGLTKHFRRFYTRRVVRAVNGISLKLEGGTAFGLLGPNGSGKTTFIKMLLSSIVPSAGTAQLFGKDCRQPEARRQVGYLPENHRFPTYNTGRQMLHFYSALSGTNRAERINRAGELLERVGLADWADIRIGKYSKGMLQRLGLAQALMHRPALLMLDEPGDGVDPVGRRMIRDILQELQKEGTTIFLNSHLLAEVELFCDEVAIIRRGELALTGRIDQLTSGSGYHVSSPDAPEGALDELRAKTASIESNNGMVRMQFTDRAALNEGIDILRKHGSQIEEVQRQRSTLEDVFMSTIEESRTVENQRKSDDR